jgi:DNA-binding MarR family transcriptional regulator
MGDKGDEANDGASDGVRWLSPDERRVWLGWIMSTRLLWEEFERDLQRDSGLSFGYYEILVMLSETPGRRRRMSELADATQSSRSRLSHAVARLEELGWVRREACPDDRRGQLAVLTDEGFRALEEAAPKHVESVRRHLFDLLSPAQLAQLQGIDDTLLEHLLPLASSRGDIRSKLMEEARARLDA